MSTAKSYTSVRTSPLALWREWRGLYSMYVQRSSDGARANLSDARAIEALVQEHFGLEIRNLDVLDVGPGQFLGRITYFALQNRVTGIDLDVIAQRFSPSLCVRMLRQNGFRRTTKTILRKALGFDHRFASSMKRELGVTRLPELNILQMDACRLKFPSNSFDFVYSNSVFHHLPEPGAAIASVSRVLKSGGVAYIDFHPYTSDTGCLDPRLFAGLTEELGSWPHLRPSRRHIVKPANTWVNKLRHHEWRALFESEMPGVQFILTPSTTARVERARTLQEQGELLEYSLEELCTGRFAALWMKP